ncbi:MAG TPA: RNA methyltransferase [Vicinamibacterales bacterium]|nr:RNA methyltransferase [Vicinamibacterales bacterium]
MPEFVHVNALDDPRVSAYRHIADPNRLLALNLFVAEGRLVVRRLLDLQDWSIESILLTQPAAEALADILPKTTAPIYIADQAVMNGVAGFNIHRGCLALVKRPQTATLDRIAAGPLSRVLVLEGVNNPDNVGGLFRSAAAFGIDLVVLGPDTGDPLYRKAIRTSMGATLSLPFVKTAQWPGAIVDLRTDGFTVIALTPALSAAALDEIFPHAKLALLVGSEGSGLSEAAMRAATLRIRIPTTPDVDSLNVTTAASIAMYHCFAEKRG